MDPILLTALIILIVLIAIAIYMFIDGSTGTFYDNCPSTPGTPCVVGQHFTKFNENDIEAFGGKESEKSEKNVGAVGHIISHIHRGSQSLHSQGLCNMGGGAWGTVTSPTGRPAGPGTWSQVSGGIFDSCQCEDNGGLH